MRYATWQFDFTNPNYGTGPEEKAKEFGGELSGLLLIGEPKGGTLLGYILKDVADADLSNWNFQEISQNEALALAQDFYLGAFLDDEGLIVIPKTQPSAE